MNYRTLAKGALALSLSLIVGSAMAVNTTTTDVQKYGATFENQANPPENDYDYVVDTPVTTYATSSGNGESSGWFGGEGDESKIIAANGGQALQLNTDAGVLTNKLESSKASEINAGIAAAGAYIETEAKFVASDTLDAGVAGGTDDTKFAIYAYADESKSPCTTNLVVYHAIMDGLTGAISFTNEIFNILINTEVYTKLRVEMKKYADPVIAGVSYNAFAVKIGDSPFLESDTALDATLGGSATGIWFLTVEDRLGNVSNAELSSITFKGTGEVDNLAVGIINETTTYAIDWSASQNVIASNLTDNVQLAAGDTNFVAGVQLGFYPTVGTIQSVTVNGTAETVADPYLYTVGTADAIVTVVAAQVLDDNWTIEGFNPRGEWTDPTAVAADSKTLFYSNLVVNIDPIGEGRTIVAAWVGAKVTASAAAAADLSAWNFEYDAQDGTRKTYAFNAAKDGEDYLYWWVPITAAEVRTAIANQSDIVKTMVVYTDSASSAEAQTLTVSICPKNIEITNTDDVENGETIEVNDWQEQGAVEPTVITIALVNGATYTDDNGTLTFAATEGYTVSSIYTNGVNTGSTTTFTTNGLTGTVKIIAAATKTRTAPEHKWYENPGKVYGYASPISGGGEDQPGCNWALENGNDFIFDTKGWTIGGGMLYDFNEIEGNANTENTISPIWKVARAKFGVDLRGGTVSKEHNVVIIGVYGAANAYAAPISDTAADANGNLEDYVTITFKDKNGNTLSGVSAYRFSADGKYLYAGGNTAYIYKFALAGVDFSSNVELQAVDEYNLASKSRNFAYGVVNGSEVIFAVTDGLALKKIDLATGTVSESGTVRTKYDQLNIAGSNLYVGQSVYSAANDNSIVILKRYSIGASLGLTLEQSWTKGDMLEICSATANAGIHPMAFAVSSDEKSLLIAFQTNPQTRYLIQYVEPQYTATYTGSENVIVTNTYDGTSSEWDEARAGTQIACLSGTVLSFYPTEGNVITNVTIGGVAQTGFDPACYSITVVSDTNLVVLAGATARTKPAWATDANDEKFWAWVDNNNVSDYDTVDYSAQYLMNVAPGVTPVLKIDSIGVAAEAGVVQLIVSATDGTDPISLKTINGVLNVAVGDTLAALTPTACNAAVNNEDGRATINLPANSGNFFRARVDFTAPAAPAPVGE